jgi:Pvc16 N-terminal domain
MPLPTSTLSRVCRSVADFVGTELAASQNSIRVMIGSPADASKDSENEHRVNLFFYLMEPLGFGPDPAPDEIWNLRLHCLVTAFGVEETPISAGENDLRLLGEVLRAFHETPILAPLDLDGDSVRLRIIFSPLSLDQINHLWATQGEVAYHPSVAYEMELVPIHPSQPSLGDGPRVGAIGLDARAAGTGPEERHAPFAGGVTTPLPAFAPVDTTVSDWAPQVSLVAAGECAASVAFAVGSPELAAFVPQVWIAGLPAAPVVLRWESWEATTGWQALPGETPAQASAPAIDPNAAGGATTVALPLPFSNRPAQLLLYAARSAPRFPDGATVEVRSNPLLVSLYKVGP